MKRLSIAVAVPALAVGLGAVASTSPARAAQAISIWTITGVQTGLTADVTLADPNGDCLISPLEPEGQATTGDCNQLGAAWALAKMPHGGQSSPVTLKDAYGNCLISPLQPGGQVTTGGCNQPGAGWTVASVEDQPRILLDSSGLNLTLLATPGNPVTVSQ